MKSTIFTDGSGHYGMSPDDTAPWTPPQREIDLNIYEGRGSAVDIAVARESVNQGVEPTFVRGYPALWAPPSVGFELLEWYEPGIGVVTVAGKGVAKRDMLTFAEGLRASSR